MTRNKKSVNLLSKITKEIRAVQRKAKKEKRKQRKEEENLVKTLAQEIFNGLDKNQKLVKDLVKKSRMRKLHKSFVTLQLVQTIQRTLKKIKILVQRLVEGSFGVYTKLVQKLAQKIFKLINMSKRLIKYLAKRLVKHVAEEKNLKVLGKNKRLARRLPKKSLKRMYKNKNFKKLPKESLKALDQMKISVKKLATASFKMINENKKYQK